MEIDEDETIKLEVQDDIDQIKPDSIQDTVAYIHDILSEASLTTQKGFEAGKSLLDMDLVNADSVNSFLETLSTAVDSLNVSITTLDSLIESHKIETKDENGIKHEDSKSENETKEFLSKDKVPLNDYQDVPLNDSPDMPLDDFPEVPLDDDLADFCNEEESEVDGAAPIAKTKVEEVSKAKFNFPVDETKGSDNELVAEHVKDLKDNPPKQNRRNRKKKSSSEKESACKYCAKIFPSILRMKAHVKKVHAAEKLTCDLCGFKATTMPLLIGHKLSKHSKRGPGHPCGQCDLVFRTMRELIKHSGPAHGGHRFRCEQCLFTTPEEVKLKYHIAAKHSKDSTDCFSCDTCDYRTHSKRNLQCHMKKHGEKFISCTEEGCDYKTISGIQLRHHHETVHQGVRYPCEQCGITYSQQGNLLQHIKRNHLKEYRFECKECPFVTTYRTKLRNHVESIHEGKTYPCDKCAHTCVSLGALRRHRMKEHSGVRHVCSVCGTFSSHRVDKLKRHLLSVHKIDKWERP